MFSKPAQITGYESTNTKKHVTIPPPSIETPNRSGRTRATMKQTVLLNEGQIRDALVDFVGQNWCYSDKPLQSIKILSIEPASAYHYTLETFTEKRQTIWKIVPYTGQHIDSPQNGLAPNVWNVSVNNNIVNYKNGTITTEVPHTAIMKPCNRCSAQGYLPCNGCKTVGMIPCTISHGKGPKKLGHRDGCRTCLGSAIGTCKRCNGSGMPCVTCRNSGVVRCSECGANGDDEYEVEDCRHCLGSNMEPCKNCDGRGKSRCELCLGSAQLKCFIELTVTMTTHKSEQLVDKSSRSTIPQELLKDSNGDFVYHEDESNVYPIESYPDHDVALLSRRFIKEHGGTFSDERIKCQRQRVKCIPITQVVTSYKEQVETFYVYGLNNAVYFPDYYAKCCCIIL